jgi:hypothetical protein
MHKLPLVLFPVFLSWLAGCSRNPPAKQLNKIDSLSTGAQINVFIRSLDPAFKDFTVNEQLAFPSWCKMLADSLQIPYYYKADFDRNGLTDLMVLSKEMDYPVLCVLDSGANRYQMTWVNKVSHICMIPVVTTHHDTVFVDHYNFQHLGSFKGDPQRVVQVRRLVYAFGDFVEYNPAPTRHRIEKIQYKTNFTMDPDFILTIDASRNARYQYRKQFDLPYETFAGSIDTARFNNLTGLLNYAAFSRAKDRFEYPSFHAPMCELTITYDGGKEKTIFDYGMLGSYALNQAYGLIGELKDNQSWRKVVN